MEPDKEITQQSDELPSSVLSRKDLLGLARGFSRILWSIPLGFFLFTGAMDFALSIYFRLPSYIIAVILCMWGLAGLRRIHSLGRTWVRYLNMALLLTVILIYFAPFIYWWIRHPEGNHFVVNLMAMILAVTWLLWIVNRLAEEVATALHDRYYLIECRLCGWSVVAFMAMPLVVYFGHSMLQAVRHEIPLYYVLENIRRIRHAPWLFALLLLPLTLTVAIAWKTKERALRTLTDSVAPTPSPPPVNP